MKNIEVKYFDKWNDNINDFDIIHIFKLTTEDYQLLQYAKKAGKPVIISSVMPLEHSIRIRANLLLCRILPIHTNYSFMKEMMDMADSIISQTEMESDFIRKNYKIDKEKIYVIPNGVHPFEADEKTSNLIYERLNINKPYILQVGRFDSNKNQLSVIKALKDTGIPVVFIGGPFAGEPEYFERCRKASNADMFFLGWVENNDPLLASAYLNAQVVVLPSFKEIFGNSLIEGGAAGARLVATKELPIDKWNISEYCSVIDPRDIKNIREVLMKSYITPKDPELRSYICSRFSWDDVIEKHIEIYNKLINK